MADIKLEDIIKPENKVFEKTKLFTEKTLSYCPGCGHGVAHRLILEVIEEMGIEDNVIGIAPVGCSVLAYEFMDIDMAEAAHGRASAMATGIKRVYPEKFVFSYQGDGDLAAIGTGETIHTCNRGENITIIFINNGIYGMTGGQMAPTTLEGMKTSTTPYGRAFEQMGHPLKITDLVAMLPGTCYVTREAVHSARLVRKAKKAIRRAFEYQKQNKGTSFVEIVSNCNSGWKMTPLDSIKWLEDNMLEFYPLGTLKDVGLDGE
jgi:2-oxoglutarate ferredoxin oxidoreductase subunit beta